MSKKYKKPGSTAADAEIKNELIVIPTLTNGFSEAIGFNGPGIGGGINPFGFTGNQTVSETDTAFENLRWYLVSNFRQLLSQLFVEIGLVRTICCVPVDDGLRGGVMFKSKQLDEQQIKELQINMDRDNDLNTAGWAAKWTRAYGGGGILILVDDQDPEMPLDLASIGPDTKVTFRAVDMWELFWDKQNVEGYDAEIQREDFEFYNYYSKEIHKSRVMALKGDEAPSFIRPRLRGWGVSCVEVLIRSMNQYLKATDLGFQVLDEFKLDVYKIKNLVNTLMSPNGTNAIKERVQMANWQKNYQNAVVMDSEDDFDHKQLSFSGLAEAMAGIRTQVAADMRMPILKLFGQSVSTGMGTSSVEEMENYNSMVESEVRNKLKYHILKMGEIKCQQLFGMIPDDLELEFKPLRELSAIDQETVKTQKFTRLKDAKAAGEITTLEFRDACNKGNLFDVQLDTAEDGLSDDPQLDEVLSGEAADKSSGNGDDAPENDEQGANAPDSEKVKNYTPLEKVLRVFNSAAFDQASYEADGGDSQMLEGRKEFFIESNAKDVGLYQKCASEAKELGKDWKFTVWLYKKQGGKFK
jgi:phage-related protein (TIGR01555 family)